MTATAMREKVVEQLVSWIWKEQAVRGPLPADDGQQYDVVFRGRPWGERRPDFQGAVLARPEGALLRGDIEIHVRASDWRRHGHQHDPAYNSVICQVVLWQDEASPTVREDGTTIPTVELVTRLAAPLAELERRATLPPPSTDARPAGEGAPTGPSRRPHGAARRRTTLPADRADLGAERPDTEARAPRAPGTGASQPTEPVEPVAIQLPLLPPAIPSLACAEHGSDLESLLDAAGIARFREHAARFEGDLACLPSADVLYRGALRAMGYSANTAGFEQLGSLLPLDTLRAVISPGSSARELMPSAEAALDQLLHAQAALLGAGGLLASQRAIAVADGWPRQLEAAWAALAASLPAPLPPGTWRAWRVRPDNVPVRRAAGMGMLVAAWGAGDPLDTLLADLAEAERTERPMLLAARWEACTRPADFWATHHDFGQPLRTPRPWLIGAGRAAEVVVNVVLPFAYALGQHGADPALTARAEALYRAFPSGPPNRVVREMALQVGGHAAVRLVRGACRQQGLVHLYRHWCDTRDCAGCSAGPAPEPSGEAHGRRGGR